MPDHKTFCAFGAYAVDVKDPNKTVVMALANAADLDKGIDKMRFVTLDLQQRLNKVDWDKAILDTMGLHGNGTAKSALVAFDREGINVLTVGPLFLPQGQHEGGIYVLRKMFFDKIRPRFDPDPNPDPHNPNLRRWPDPGLGLHTYEVMSSASRAGNVISRYHGFHAKVTRSSDSIKHLEVRRTTGGPIPITIDMNDRTKCDDPAFLINEVQDPDRRATTELVLDAHSKKNDEGAIFLSLHFCVSQAVQLHDPKEPIGAGG